MIATIQLQNFNIHNMILANKMKNNIISEGFFYRIFYSNQHYSSNGLFIYFNLYDIQIEKYFNKIKCHISDKKNSKTIRKIIEIETRILNHFIPKNRIKKHKIKEQLTCRFIKIFSNKIIQNEFRSNIDLVLKISGLWENDYESGITFRFYNINPLIKNHQSLSTKY